MLTFMNLVLSEEAWRYRKRVINITAASSRDGFGGREDSSAGRGARRLERNEEFCCKPGRFSVISMLLWVFIGRGKSRFRLKEALLGLYQLSPGKLESVRCSEGFNEPVTARESSDQPSRVWD